MKEFLKQQVDLADDRYYSLLTSWVFSTYQTERVPCTPHLHIIGAKGTGKTRLLEALKAVVYRGYIPIVMTPAALYYLVTQHHLTLLLDEAQIYSNEEHGALRVLMSVYRKGESIPRVRYDAKKPENRLEHYTPYGFKAYASLNELDENIADRCLQVRMQPAVKEISRTINEERAQNLRNSLYYYRNVPLRKVPEQLWKSMAINNRLSELFETLFINTPNDGAEKTFNSKGPCNLVEPDQTETECRQDTLNLFSLMNELNREKNTEKKESIEAEILQEFQRQAKDSKDSWASTSAICEKINERNHDYRDHTSPFEVATVLKQAGFKQKRKPNSRGFTFDPAAFQRLAK